MVNSNAVVNALGPTFMSQLVAERGAEPADVVRAYRIAREVTGARMRWDAVESLPRTTDRRVVLARIEMHAVENLIAPD